MQGAGSCTIVNLHSHGGESEKRHRTTYRSLHPTFGRRTAVHSHDPWRVPNRRCDYERPPENRTKHPHVSCAYARASYRRPMFCEIDALPVTKAAPICSPRMESVRARMAVPTLWKLADEAGATLRLALSRIKLRNTICQGYRGELLRYLIP